MKITFVRHSCYTIELEKHFLIFDYIGGPITIPKNKRILCFVTHGHKDHYDSSIFSFPGKVNYIISDDIKEDLSSYDVTWVHPDGTYLIEDVKVKTYGSTDEGVSIYCNVEGKGIYHSGDLHFWIWPRYSPFEVQKMEQDFKKEVDKVKGEKMDVAMIIVDPRLKKDYAKGPHYFLKSLSASYFFPIHMWGEFSLSEQFQKEFQKEFPNKKIMTIKKEGQSFDL